MEYTKTPPKINDFDYIKRSNINPFLKLIYCHNKHINPHINRSKKRKIRKKSSVSHYNI